MQKQTQNRDDADQNQKAARPKPNEKGRVSGISEAALRGATQGAQERRDPRDQHEASKPDGQPPQQQDQADEDSDQEWRRAGGAVPPHPGTPDLPNVPGPRDTAS